MELCAFVCAPIINPLNGRPVAPDRNRIKGIVRFKSWQDEDAEVWLAESYVPIQDSDLLADLHVWRPDGPVSVGEFGDDAWWTPIPSLVTVFKIPDSDEVPPLGIAVATQFARQSGAIRFQGLERPKPQQPRPGGPTAKGDSPPQRNVTIEKEVLNNAVAGALRKFIVDHHLKSSRGDVEGLVADYAEQVDHFNNGRVARAFIRKDESEYHGPGWRVTEKLVTPISLHTLDAATVETAYTIAFERAHADGKWTRGLSDVVLTIQHGSNGFQIVRQRGTLRDRTQSPR